MWKNISKMKQFCAFEFYVSVAASVALLTGASVGLPPVGDNVVVEVKLEKELHLISSNSSSLNDSETGTQPFECVIDGLSDDDLALLAKGNTNSQVYVSTRGSNNSNFDEKDVRSQSQPFNVKIAIVNGTVIVKGDVLMRKPKSDESNQSTEYKESIASCEVLFLEAEGENVSQQSSENVTSRDASDEQTAPKITSQYNHIVLMNGAPDQVISCSARGSPSPRIRWVFQNRESKPVVLSKDSTGGSDSSLEDIFSYLLFSQVNKNTSGNYTCIAENVNGRASNTFEVKVISSEAIRRCNEISSGGPSSSATPRNQEVIYYHNIQDILHRSKRHVWYQWRTYRLGDQYGSKDSHSSDLQTMVNFIAERLKLADKVAVNKWDNNLPVEDLPREKIILDNMVRQAEARGLNPDWAYRFFRDQIEGNKDIQFELLRLWQIQGRRPYGPPVDLVNEVRPEIDYINGKLIELAKSTEHERRDWGCKMDVEENARYAAFIYNLDHLHQRALQRATENLCVTSYYGGGGGERPPYFGGSDGGGGERPPYLFHPYHPSQLPPY